MKYKKVEGIFSKKTTSKVALKESNSQLCFNQQGKETVISKVSWL